MAPLALSACRHILIVGALLGLWAGTARAQGTYSLDPAHARIGFSVSHLGLFQSEGQFQRFQSQLLIDPARPERTQITVDIDAASVALPTAEAVSMLRSPAHLDVAEYPRIHFRSTSVRVLDDRHFRINGRLEIRGIAGDVALDATMTDRRPDPAGHGDVTDFNVTGTVDRTAYGMVADRDFISDFITLRISARLLLAALHDGP